MPPFTFFFLHYHNYVCLILLQEKFKDLEDSVEISVSVFFSMKDIPNLLQDPANPKVSAAKRNASIFL